MDAIHTTQLCKAYGSKNAVDHIDLIVPEGAVYGFIGRNGSGKSTTQKMVCGLARPTSGSIQLFEKPLTDEEARSKVGTLIETPGIYPGMSAIENIILQGYSVGVKDPKAEALRSLEMVGLQKSAKKKAKSLSLGMKQRLGIAIAMLGSPKLLVLDEPINGLDPEGIIELRNIIGRLNSEYGITIFISSHILGELSKIATHYGIIKDGKLIQQMSAEDLAARRKDYLHVRVNESEKAIVLLREALNPTEYELCEDGEIHLYGVNDTGAVNQILSTGGVGVQEIYLHQQDLEDYFLKLMGGDQVA